VTQTGIRISVILPAYDSWGTLPEALEALRPEVDRPDRELILVESSGTCTPEDLARRWPWATTFALPARMLPGYARNFALAHARGELLAFTDADALPEPGWLDELERALPPSAEAVAGVVVNGTPWSRVGTSDYLLEFAEWLPGRHGHPLHGASCNLLVRRDALLRVGGFPTHLWPGEDTVLTFRIGENGRLAFAPAARVRHLSRTHFPEYLRHQYRLGSSFSRVCREVEFPHRTFARLPLALVAGPLRVPVLWLRLARWRKLPRAHARLLPAALAGGCAWSVGLSVGAARRLLRMDLEGA
jgi:GT2 family glycosyltransferase